MSQLERRTSNPTGVHTPAGMYSHLTRVAGGELLFLAGQVGLDADGRIVGEADAAEQTKQAFRNIEVILRRAGASMDDVVQFTTYVVGRESVQPYLEGRTEVYAELYPGGAYPPNTLLVIDGLVREEMLVEITAVAAPS